jgi:formamidopyrimidine-DNA glycosylase
VLEVALAAAQRADAVAEEHDPTGGGDRDGHDGGQGHGSSLDLAPPECQTLGVPELPDLVHVEEELRRALVGKRVRAARTGDPLVLRVMVREPFPDVLAGRLLEDVARRGHFLRFALEGGLVLVVNAMLVGKYRLLAAGAAAPRAKKDPVSLGLALVFDDGTELQYLDDRRMGKVYVAAAADEDTIPVYGKLGLDPTSPAFTREAFGKLIAKRRDQVRMFLMDKSAIASIGNAYADEILFAAKLHPKTFCKKLLPGEVDALYAAIPRVLGDAVAEVRRRAEPIDVKVRDFLAVRGRDGQPCPACGTKIRAVRVGDGDACFCPRCQPAARKLFVDWAKLPPRE